jgi:hypothetical protein
MARKVFATIRYRFSHLDNGLTKIIALGQTGRCIGVVKTLKTSLLINDLESR